MMKGNKGFTLVELAIVIVVIGILAAIAVPRFLTMQESAGKAALDANFDALRTTVVAIKSRTGQYPDRNEFDRGYGRDPVSGKVYYFFSSPNTRYSDAQYSGGLIETGTRNFRGATQIGRNDRCPRGYQTFYLANKYPKPDVYGKICYNPNNGDLKKEW